MKILQKEETIFENERAPNKNLQFKAQNKTSNPGGLHGAKRVVTKETKSRQKMEELIANSQKSLYKLATIFPLDLFPNKMVIELDHVNIHFRQFFSTGQMRSIPIQNIGEVIIEMSPLFTTLKIIEGMIGTGVELDLKPVRRHEAIKAKRIIMGLMIANKERVELSDLNPEDVAKKVEELGKAQEPEFTVK
jgi:hypothetical protein